MYLDRKCHYHQRRYHLSVHAHLRLSLIHIFCYEKIREVFGENVIGISGDIEPKKLAGIIFQDNNKRKQLNAIVHPFVLEGMQKFFATNYQQPIICAEIPLLFETGWDQYFDRTVVVTCSEEIAIPVSYTHLDVYKRQMDSDSSLVKIRQVIWLIGE